MVERLYQLWYIDLETRRRFQVWTILAAFAYGLFNSLALGRPEKQVTWETLGLVCFLTVASSALYSFEKISATESSKANLSYAHLGEMFRQNRMLFDAGLAATAILLCGYLAARQFPSSRVLAAGMDMRLSRTIFSPKPFDENKVNELTTIFNTAKTDRVSIDPRLVKVAGKKVVEASRDNPRTWPATLALLNYSSSLNRGPSSYPQSPCFVGLGGVQNITIIGCPNQTLEHTVWKDVVFENSTIVYHGGRLTLDNVRFKNCEFDLDYSPESQELAKALTTSDTVTLTLPRQ